MKRTPSAKPTPNLFANFTKSQFEQRAYDALKEKPFYERQIGLFRLCILLAFIAQGFSLISEFGYFQNLIALKMEHQYLLFATTALLVVVLEIAKYHILQGFFANLFAIEQLRFSLFGFLACLLLCSLSMYASIQGGGNFGKNAQSIQLAQALHENEVTTVRQEIADIQKRNTWKGRTWIPKKDKKVLHEKEAYLAELLRSRQIAVSEAELAEQQNIRQYQYGFTVFELVFIATTLFTWYFRKRVAIEAYADSGNTISSINERNLPNALRHTHSVPAYTIPEKRVNGNAYTSENTMGFSYGTQKPPVEGFAKGNCKHCGNDFTKHTTWQKYCSTECRKSAWQQRTHTK